MRKIFFILSLFSNFLFAQISQEEFELIKTYKQNIIDKDLNKTIQSLQKLIEFHKDQTHYHISLGFIYQLQRNRKLANRHLEKGRSYVIDELVTSTKLSMSNKESMDHIVALCFAGYEKDCEEMFMLTESRFVNDDYYKDYDFETIKKLGEKQRNVMKSFFNTK